MSESMVERVARAIGRADVEVTAKRTPETPKFLIEMAALIAREDHLEMARAAIEAMRGPTDAMVDAVWDREDIVEPLTLWPAMIDAALNEQVAG